jgi:hypothetical protein
MFHDRLYLKTVTRTLEVKIINSRTIDIIIYMWYFIIFTFNRKHNFILVNCIVYNLFVNDSLLYNLIEYRLITHDIFLHMI